MPTLRPLADRVVVKVLKSKDVTAGGIVLPETAQEKPQEGRVVAVGTGRLMDDGTRLPVAVQVGQRVIFAKYAGNEVEVGGEEYTLVRESDLLVVVSD